MVVPKGTKVENDQPHFGVGRGGGVGWGGGGVVKKIGSKLIDSLS